MGQRSKSEPFKQALDIWSQTVQEYKMEGQRHQRTSKHQSQIPAGNERCWVQTMLAQGHYGNGTWRFQRAAERNKSFFPSSLRKGIIFIKGSKQHSPERATQWKTFWLKPLKRWREELVLKFTRETWEQHRRRELDMEMWGGGRSLPEPLASDRKSKNIKENQRKLKKIKEN